MSCSNCIWHALSVVAISQAASHQLRHRAVNKDELGHLRAPPITAEARLSNTSSLSHTSRTFVPRSKLRRQTYQTKANTRPSTQHYLKHLLLLGQQHMRANDTLGLIQRFARAAKRGVSARSTGNGTFNWNESELADLREVIASSHARMNRTISKMVKEMELWSPTLVRMTTAIPLSTLPVPTQTSAIHQDLFESDVAFLQSRTSKVLHATFAVIALLLALNFLRRGMSFTMINDGKTRTPWLHLMVAAASLALAVANALEFERMPTPFPLPWCYSARAISTALLVCVVGLLCNAKDITIATVLTVAAWAQMGAATGSPKAQVSWSFFILSIITGSAAVWKIYGMVEEATQSELDIIMEGSLRPLLDLGTTCSAVHALMWLVTEGIHIVPGTLAVAFNGFFELLLIGGCGHLLLKREDLILMYTSGDDGE